MDDVAKGDAASSDSGTETSKTIRCGCDFNFFLNKV